MSTETMGPREAALAAYCAARDVIDRQLVRLRPRRRDRAGRVEAALRFNAACGDPQRAFRSVQVAGTSGKGSVCAMLADALHLAGLSVGLHVSPYLQAITEKTWIDGRYAPPHDFARAVETVRPVGERFFAMDLLPASVHGLTSLAASYAAFADAGVDLAVLETGLGGRFDLVQGLDLEVTAITDLGLDHLESLGGSLDSIAWHKAGVMRPGVPCVAIDGPGREVLEREAARVGAPLRVVTPDAVYRPVEGGWALDLPGLGTVELPARWAPHRRRNAAVAGFVLSALAARGWAIPLEAAQQGLREGRLPGRGEVFAGTPEVVLDGAHNPQKLGGLLEELGEESGVWVLGSSGGRDLGPWWERLRGRARVVVATQAELYGKTTATCAEVCASARAHGVEAVAGGRPGEALERARGLARAGERVVVTGSLYVVGEARSALIPWEEVVLSGSSWPGGARRLALGEGSC